MDKKGPEISDRLLFTSWRCPSFFRIVCLICSTASPISRGPSMTAKRGLAIEAAGQILFSRGESELAAMSAEPDQGESEAGTSVPPCVAQPGVLPPVFFVCFVSALGVELSDLVFREDVAFSNSESMFLLDVMRCEEFPTPLLAARARRVYMLCLARSF